MASLIEKNEKSSDAHTYVRSVEIDEKLNRMDTQEIIDEAVLAACGYKQEFRREFSLFSTFSVSFSVLGILSSIASTLSYGLGYSGTAGLTWGWVIAALGIQAVATSMAELSSSMPTSGGNYYAVGVLAPPRWAPFLAYITGWSNWLGLVSGTPSVNYGNAAMISALLKLNNPDYSSSNARTFGICVGLNFLCFLCSVMPTRWVAKLNSGGTFIQLAGLATVMIGVLTGSKNTPRFAPSSKVWGEITNGTEWPNGIAVLMSFLQPVWVMSGYDAPFHLSEECSNAQIATPRAIVLTSAIGGILGWFASLVISYTIVDLEAILGSDLGQTFVAYLDQVLDRRTATAFGAITIVCGFLSAQGCTIASSRLAFAYARDGVMPASGWIAMVNPHTKTPVHACIFNFVVQAIFSIGAVGGYFAFTLPVILRCFFAGDRWRPGPWNLGRWSLPCGYVASSFVALMIPILCLPAYKGADLTPSTMNWTCVVWGGPLFLASLFFLVYARKTYTGPKIKIEHMVMPDGSTISASDLREAKQTGAMVTVVPVSEA